METTATENWRLVERARRRGWDVLLNAAPAGDIPSTILRQVDWLVVNGGEAMAIAARAGLAPGNTTEAARRLATTAGLRCIVTLGGEGAIAVDGAILWRIGVLPTNRLRELRQGPTPLYRMRTKDPGPTSPDPQRLSTRASTFDGRDIVGTAPQPLGATVALRGNRRDPDQESDQRQREEDHQRREPADRQGGEEPAPRRILQRPRHGARLATGINP